MWQCVLCNTSNKKNLPDKLRRVKRTVWSQVMVGSMEELFMAYNNTVTNFWYVFEVRGQFLDFPPSHHSKFQTDCMFWKLQPFLFLARQGFPFNFKWWDENRNICDNHVLQWWVEWDDELSWLFAKRLSATR